MRGVVLYISSLVNLPFEKYNGKAKDVFDLEANDGVATITQPEPSINLVTPGSGAFSFRTGLV